MELPPYNPALREVSSNDLWEELKRRFPAVVLIVMHPRAEDDAMDVATQFSGGHWNALGMVTEAQHEILRMRE